MKRINPFKKVYDKCNFSDEMQKINNLPEFPRYIDLELTNHCNYNCLMCPVGTGVMKRKRGFMSEEIFYRVLEEIKKYKTPLRFIRWGEPTIHNRYIDYIKQAKDLGIICHFNTNGTILEKFHMERLINIGLDSIKFSFQGVDRRGYNEMRNEDYFDQIIKKVKMLYNLRGEKKHPYIQVATTITYESEDMVRAFIDEIEDYCDLVSVGRTLLDHIEIEKSKLNEIDKTRLKELRKKQNTFKKRFECCPEVFDKLSINWDGTVSACCNDYDDLMIVGDLKKNSLKEIWQSEKMSLYREILSQKRYEELEVCKDCYDYMDTQV